MNIINIEKEVHGILEPEKYHVFPREIEKVTIRFSIKKEDNEKLFNNLIESIVFAQLGDSLILHKIELFNRFEVNKIYELIFIEDMNEFQLKEIKNTNNYTFRGKNLPNGVDS